MKRPGWFVGVCALLLVGCGAVEKPPAALVEAPPLLVQAEANADPDEHRPPAPHAPVLLMPGAAPEYSLDQIPVRPNVIGKLDVPLTRDWKHIVIHHSFTQSGNEAIFDRYHREQKGWLGVGYHFVIGNGHGSPDGAIEVTFRWEKQLQGAHAGVDEYNTHGIGICLVGNFEQNYPTEKQMASLVALTNYLQDRCRIPTSHIFLHRHLKPTGCPGRNFPFFRFLSLLAH